MKPIIITLLALPIVGMFHDNTKPLTSVAVIPIVSKKIAIGKITAPKPVEVAKSPIVPVPTPKAPSAPVVAPVAPAPVPVVAPAPVTYAPGCGNYQSAFAQYNWSVSTAMAICQAESRGDPNAVSPTDDYGLMQIHNGLEIYGSKIYDPYFNISVAYIKYQTQGWYAWTTYTSGIYRNYL